MRRTALAIAAAVTVGTVVTGAGSAVAGASHGHPIKVYAPYAQAAAQVAPNGFLVKAKNVDASRKVSTGTYCVHLINRINPTTSIPTGTLESTDTAGGAIHILTYPTRACGYDKHTLTVLLFDEEGEPANGGFYVTVQ